MQVEPKKKYIEETRSLTSASREMLETETANICGLELRILPKVFNPSVFFSSCWFAKTVSDYVSKVQAGSFLEIGSGTGIVSLIVAKENEAISITACDINPEAVQNTRLNFERAGKDADIYESNVFSNISGKFDVIFWAMPFGYLEDVEQIDLVDTQTFDPGYKAIEAYFREGASHLNENGTLLFGFSPEIGHMELITEFANKYGWELNLIAEEEGTEKSTIKMQIFAARLL